MNIDNSKMIIHLFDPLGKSKFPLIDAIIVTEITSCTINESCVKLYSAINIVVPFTVGFLFHNEPAYKYIKVILQDKTTFEEKVIWWGKVDTIGHSSNIKQNTISIQGSSFASTYNNVSVDNKTYKNTSLWDIFKKNGMIICSDAFHGSRSSVMQSKDICFVPKGSDYNPILETFARAVGETLSNVIKNLLAKASLYIFSTIYEGQPKIIINSLPLLPDGEHGFEPGASYFKKGQVLQGIYGSDQLSNWNANNIISCSFTGNYTSYRDRIRILISDNDEYPSPNTELDNVPTDRREKPLHLAPFVPMVMSRENFSKAEAKKISESIWNNINKQSPSFHLSIAGWELFDTYIEVGKIISFSFKASSIYNPPDIQPDRKKEILSFIIKEEEMIITDCTRNYSHKGFTTDIILVQKDSFANEKKKTKRRMFKEDDTSYYNGFDGRADE